VGRKHALGRQRVSKADREHDMAADAFIAKAEAATRKKKPAQ
jgi:hypothetical protein